MVDRTLRELVVSDLRVAVPGGRTRLSGIAFRASVDARVALSGPSGFGKTTVLRALALLDDAHIGALTLSGRSPFEMGIPSWRRRVAMVAQRPQFFGGTVHEELARPFSYRVTSRPFDSSSAQNMLARVGVSHLFEQSAHRLSEGEKQRVSLVRTLLLEPDVVLLDEPTSALDAEARARVESLLMERDVTQIWVTHDVAQSERVGAQTIDLTSYRQSSHRQSGSERDA